jgi:hypothetical protein
MMTLKNRNRNSNNIRNINKMESTLIILHCNRKNSIQINLKIKRRLLNQIIPKRFMMTTKRIWLWKEKALTNKDLNIWNQAFSKITFLNSLYQALKWIMQRIIQTLIIVSIKAAWKNLSLCSAKNTNVLFVKIIFVEVVLISKQFKMKKLKKIKNWEIA